MTGAVKHGGEYEGRGDAAVGYDDVVRVLLVEDDAPVAATVRTLLAASGLLVQWAPTGAAAKRMHAEFHPHVVLVDIGLPDTSGVTLIAWLVQQGDCGIIVLSGLTDEADRVLSLELGADDYVLKPPGPRELVARIRAVHRRVITTGRGQGGAGNRGAAAGNARVVRVGEVMVNLASGSVTDAEGRPVDLTAAEHALLERLVRANGQAVSREALCRDVLRRAWRFEDRSIDQLVFQLRHKLSPAGDGRRLVQTVRGVGYLLRFGNPS